jgi:F-type H+-transporting ATPase subunit gamma
MATLRDIRHRIASVRSTQQITKAMKMVAAAKLRKAQAAILATRPYADKIAQTIGHLMATMESSRSPLLQKRDVKRILVVVVTADRGLCGAFNGNLIRHSLKYIKTLNDKEISIYPVGKKAFEYFKRTSYTMFSNKVNFFNHLKFEDAIDIINHIQTAYIQKQFDEVTVIYNEFRSAVQQIIRTIQFLPFIPDEQMFQQKSRIDFIYEPDKEDILNFIIPKHLNIHMWKVLLESNAGEQGARMTAMESATNNAEELIAYLTLTYNRARQAAITKEISEIVGGAEALKG